MRFAVKVPPSEKSKRTGQRVLADSHSVPAIRWYRVCRNGPRLFLRPFGYHLGTRAGCKKKSAVPGLRKVETPFWWHSGHCALSQAVRHKFVKGRHTRADGDRACRKKLVAEQNVDVGSSQG